MAKVQLNCSSLGDAAAKLYKVELVCSRSIMVIYVVYPEESL